MLIEKTNNAVSAKFNRFLLSIKVYEQKLLD